MDIKALTDEVEHISRAYASRFEINRDDTWFLLKLQEEVGELTQAHLMRTGQARTKGMTAEEIDEAFRSEVADVLAHRAVNPRSDGGFVSPMPRLRQPFMQQTCLRRGRAGRWARPAHTAMAGHLG